MVKVPFHMQMASSDRENHMACNDSTNVVMQIVDMDDFVKWYTEVFDKR